MEAEHVLAIMMAVGNVPLLIGLALIVLWKPRDWIVSAALERQ